MSLVTIDSVEILKIAKENPDAFKGLQRLFPDVFTATPPLVGDHYVRGNIVFVVASVTASYYELVELESGFRWSDPSALANVFNGKEKEFKKCNAKITYTEIGIPTISGIPK